MFRERELELKGREMGVRRCGAGVVISGARRIGGLFGGVGVAFPYCTGEV